MNKNEFELAKLRLESENFHRVMDTIAKIATILGWVAAIHLIMTGLASIVQANPDAIQALSKVVQNLELNAALGWIGTAMTGSAWLYERKGKKRAYRLNRALRKQIEAGDPHRATSGLDENGHTPE